MQPLPPPQNAQPQSNSQARDTLNSNGLPQSSVTRPSLTVTGDQGDTTKPPKKRKHRGGKKRRNRRQSFAAPPSEASGITSNMDAMREAEDDMAEEPDDTSPVRPGDSFYKRRNRSHESLDSDVLLDHRYQQPMRTRRESRLNPIAAQKAGMGAAGRQRSSDLIQQARYHPSRRTSERERYRDDEGSDQEEANDRTPLMPIPPRHHSPAHSGYGLFRSNTRGSSKSSHNRRKNNKGGSHSLPKYYDDPGYNINNPPSVPGSPHVKASIDDPMMPEPDFLARSPDGSRNNKSRSRDALIDIDRQEILEGESNSAPPSPRLNPDGISRSKRNMTFGGGEMDVCLPPEALSEMGEDDFDRITTRDDDLFQRRRRKKREWPQLWVLDEWSREEKEERAAGERRAQRVHEPVLVEGRLRPSKPSAWHREEEAAPFRYTYFNEEFEGTIHAQTISELVPPGGSFRELFIPDPPELEESSGSESDNEIPAQPKGAQWSGMVSPKQPTDENDGISRLNSIVNEPPRSRSQEPDRISSIRSEKNGDESRDSTKPRSTHTSGEQTPQRAESTKKEKPKKYGPRPTFWLDVMSPTDQEMRVLSKAFGIHALTAEDIMMQEAREKVELFKNYYFINYRTFEQDTNSEDYLEPINVYVVVFRYGILTFHFSQIPHPANVRRRIRQLKDYLILSADWISYAIIDDITDVYVPMIHNIEVEVDDIDEAILNYEPGVFALNQEQTGKQAGNDDKSSVHEEEKEKKKDISGYNMLRRVGEARKKVMSLYRLLGNKADVIKGFAKRCNEQWDVAPKTEIGLYLGDIQDHILTMTSNLSHYETLLSRAHSNYLAQVSIRMNERSEQTSDVLNKLSVLGTIVLPMNIICGMWGMNVKVPGQEVDSLWWFYGSKLLDSAPFSLQSHQKLMHSFSSCCWLDLLRHRMFLGMQADVRHCVESFDP